MMPVPNRAHRLLANAPHHWTPTQRVPQPSIMGGNPSHLGGKQAWGGGGGPHHTEGTSPNKGDATTWLMTPTHGSQMVQHPPWAHWNHQLLVDAAACWVGAGQGEAHACGRGSNPARAGKAH